MLCHACLPLAGQVQKAVYSAKLTEKPGLIGIRSGSAFWDALDILRVSFRQMPAWQNFCLAA